MADEKKPAPRKRSPRRSTTTASETAVTSESTETPPGAGAALMTTETSVVKAEGSDSDAEPRHGAFTVDERNALTIGHLLVHYPERDVEIFLDGATAQRVLAVFSGRLPKSAVQDQIVLGQSDMTTVWSTFDVERPLGITWLPGLPTRVGRRMTVDPPAPNVE